MNECLYIAWRYICFHKTKTAILVAAITLIIYLPAGVDALVDESAGQLRRRAHSTPLIIGAKGSETQLVLNSLYFESEPPATTTFAEADRVQRSGLATAVPLLVRYRAEKHPIVGTTIEYFDFRKLRIRQGRLFGMLGECVLGYDVAKALRLEPGDSLLSDPEQLFDIAGVYPLKMRVVGVLEPIDSPDDSAVFVDLKTAWIIAGLGHGHQDLQEKELLKKEGNRQTANASVATYTEITPENMHTFHFHGEPGTFPITAVIAIPHGEQDPEKSLTLLLGRYQSEKEQVQAVVPSTVMDGLLATILRVRTFVLAGALLLGIATILLVVLVFMLSLRLRREEVATLTKIGGSRSRIIGILACEVFLVIVSSGAIATALTLATAQFGESLIRWFLL
ncbi:MAG: membrane protein [Gemmatales bacterium]|nr:MAG: membrane protein [Gemmatales bacterium]